MTITVERCSDNTFRLTNPAGQRESISNPQGGYWDRAAAIEAKNLYVNVYKYKRKNIRFYHAN